MKSLFVFVAFIVSGVILGQDLNIPDNPYDNVPEYISKRKSFQREKWFYEQRMYPNNYIPEGAYENAYRQKMEMRQQSGYYSDNAVTWTPLGPTPGFYFSYQNISGRTTTAAYDPANPNIIYIGCAFGGIWKSTNGGLNWNSKTDNEISMSTGSIVIDPTNSNIIYYGTGEATYSAASYYGHGILKSTDGGDSWVNYTAGLPTLTYCSRLLIKPDSVNILYAAMGTGGLYRSTNSGMNWTLVLNGRCDDVVSSPTGDSVYSTGLGSGIRYSFNGGYTFSTPTGVVAGTRNHIAICRNVPSVLYISTYSGSTIRVYKSTDGGVSYTQVAVGTDFAGGQAWYDFYMHVNPFDPDYAYVGSIDVWRTTNGGTSFQNITNGYAGGVVHVDQHNMAFHPTNSNELLSLNDGGVWKSTDRGSSWINLNSDISVTQFYRIAADPSNASHIAGGTQDNGTQRTTGPLNWAAAFGGDGGEVCFQSQANNFVLGETQNNGIYKSQNGGNGWFSSQSGLTGNGAWVGPIISHPTQAGVFYTARQQVFKSEDNGSFWVPISTGTSGTISEMAISKSNGNIIYCTSAFRIYRSTDGGVNFSYITVGLPSRTITSINVHPDSSDVVMVTYSGFGAGKVYKTTNAGVNWFNVSGNLPDSPCNDAMFFYPGSATSTLLCAMDIGVFVSTNYGSSWSELAQGLPNTVAMHLDYHQATGKLRIGTHGRGVWEANGVIGIVNYNSEVPSSYSLSQNYPNPFNPATNIKYQIIRTGNVKLTVHDMLGREVRNIINTNQAAGTYTVQFDASGLSSGVYFYTLKTGEFVSTKKMIVVK